MPGNGVNLFFMIYSNKRSQPKVCYLNIPLGSGVTQLFEAHMGE